MKRTMVQLSDGTYDALRRRAFHQGKSMSAVVRETLTGALDAAPRARQQTLGDFASVGAGRSRQGTLAPVSERHDEALAQAIGKRSRR